MRAPAPDAHQRLITLARARRLALAALGELSAHLRELAVARPHRRCQLRPHLPLDGGPLGEPAAGARGVLARDASIVPGSRRRTPERLHQKLQLARALPQPANLVGGLASLLGRLADRVCRFGVQCGVRHDLPGESRHLGGGRQRDDAAPGIECVGRARSQQLDLDGERPAPRRALGNHGRRGLAGPQQLIDAPGLPAAVDHQHGQ